MEKIESESIENIGVLCKVGVEGDRVVGIDSERRSIGCERGSQSLFVRFRVEQRDCGKSLKTGMPTVEILSLRNCL